VFYRAKLDGFDYPNFLRAAMRKDFASLARVFQCTANGKLMGEGADSHCRILPELLRFCDHRAFVRVLAAESPKVRKAVFAAIKYAWPHPGWKPAHVPRSPNTTHAIANEKERATSRKRFS